VITCKFYSVLFNLYRDTIDDIGKNKKVNIRSMNLNAYRDFNKREFGAFKRVTKEYLESNLIVENCDKTDNFKKHIAKQYRLFFSMGIEMKGGTVTNAATIIYTDIFTIILQDEGYQDREEFIEFLMTADKNLLENEYFYFKGKSYPIKFITNKK